MGIAGWHAFAALPAWIPTFGSAGPRKHGTRLATINLRPCLAPGGQAVAGGWRHRAGRKRLTLSRAARSGSKSAARPKWYAARTYCPAWAAHSPKR